MKTLEKIEKKGYKVTFFMSGNGVQATKGRTTVIAKNITQLNKKVN